MTLGSYYATVAAMVVSAQAGMSRHHPVQRRHALTACAGMSGSGTNAAAHRRDRFSPSSMLRRLFVLCSLALSVPVLHAQGVAVTFRFVPDLSGPAPTPQSVFLPGEFNGWNITTPRMTYVAPQNEFRYTATLTPRAAAYAYKVNVGGNANGWMPDPLNPVTAGPESNSQVVVADPMVFQLAREQEGTGSVRAVSAGVFGTRPVTALTFEVNGVVRSGLDSLDQTTRIFRYTLPTPVAPGSQFRITATDDQSRTATSSVGLAPAPVVREKRPAGVEDGVTYDPTDPTRVTLSLFAPGKSTVYAIGDFNGWTTSASSLMKKDSVRADSVHFWIELTGLVPGQEYRYQYRVDGDIKIADLFAARVYSPGESGYPAGQTEIVSTLQTGQSSYAWQVNDFRRPAQKDLVVYELNVRDFTSARSFAALTDTLGYLQRLGVNAIELMPVAEYHGRDSWGYDPAFHLALEKDYGTATAFKRFVDEAHRRGMAVLLDVVYNHAYDTSPLVRLYGGTASNRFINVPARHQFNVFYDLNHEDPYVQYWVDRANRWWQQEYRVDGFRFDLAGGFMQRGNFIGYNQNRVDLLTRMAARIWERDASTYVILENLINSLSEYQTLAAFGRDRGWPGAMLWINAHPGFRQSTMGVAGGTSTANAYFGAGGVGLTLPASVSYMESHDEQWLMYSTRTQGAATADYSARDLPTALDRHKAAGAFFFTLPGPKMLWQFGELGYGGGAGECLLGGSDACPSGTPGRIAAKPVRWEYRADPDRYRLYQTWAAMIALRAAQPVFTDPATQVSLNVDGLVKRIGLRGVGADGQPLDVVVVGNFSVGEASVLPAFPAAGTWHDYFGRQAVTVADPTAALTLRPGEFRIFTSRFVGYAPLNLVVGAEREAGAPGATALDAVWPSPARGGAQVRYHLADAGPVRVEVYDVLGRRVLSVVDGVEAPGTHTAALDAGALAPGTYLVRLTADGAQHTRPLVVAR